MKLRYSGKTIFGARNLRNYLFYNTNMALMRRRSPIAVFNHFIECFKDILSDGIKNNPKGIILRVKNFGNFCISPVKQRIGRNVMTGEKMTSDGGYRIIFRPSRNFKGRFRPENLK